MGHARLKSLTVKAFRSFTEPSTVEFPESGMMLFQGFNADTGGSSGSGKSSLLLAISYLFGFCRFPATALQSWLTDEPMEVTGALQVAEGELVVTRGQKLTLSLNGKKLPGSAKQLEERLSALVGLPADLLSALTYRGQKQPGLFLAKTDSEKKEFLTILLDLGKFELEIERSQERVRKIESEVHSLDYIASDLQKKLDGYRANFKPAQIHSEAALAKQLEQAQAARDRLYRQVLDLRLKIRSHETEIERRAQQVRADAEPRIHAMERNIAELSALTPDEQQIDRSTMERLRTDLSQAEAFLKEELAADQVRYRIQRNQAESVYAQLLLLEKKLGEKSLLQQRIAQAEKEIAELDADLDRLGRSICPTCERLWDDAAAKRLEAEGLRFATITKKANWASDYRKLDDLKPQIESLQAEYRALGEFVPAPIIEELRGIVAGLNADIAAEQARIDGEIALLWSGLKQHIAEAQAALQQTKLGINAEIERRRADALETLQGDQEALETLERELAMNDSQIKGIQAAVSRVQVDNAREEARATQVQATMRDLEQDIAQAQTNLAAEKVRLHAELDFQQLIGREGFLGAIFDEVLWEISQETNRLLAQFPNTAHVTLNFRSESVTQKGTVKKAIVPIVTIGGNEAPLSSGLSGGMETAVELAVDLAVATVVSQRTGAVPGWLILDESFTGLGPVEAEASMEILRAFAEDKLVLVVDHASEFKAMFTQYVKVHYEAGRSRVA